VHVKKNPMPKETFDRILFLLALLFIFFVFGAYAAFYRTTAFFIKENVHKTLFWSKLIDAQFKLNMEKNKPGRQ
jgi:hypothetical protein